MDEKEKEALKKQYLKSKEKDDGTVADKLKSWWEDQQSRARGDWAKKK